MEDKHDKAGVRGWKKYALEFLMMFLAVTLGFFAENIRQDFEERAHERQYMRSLCDDLALDEKKLPELLSWIQHDCREAEFLQENLPKADPTTDATDIYLDLRHIVRQLPVRIFVTDRTVTQLRNAGGMRLIGNQAVVNAMLDYYHDVELIDFLQGFSANLKLRFSESFATLLRGDDWDKVIKPGTDDIVRPKEVLHLRRTDPDTINQCLLHLSAIKGIHHGFEEEISQLKSKATKLRQQIIATYHF
jgi:hypothetical protein